MKTGNNQSSLCSGEGHPEYSLLILLLKNYFEVKNGNDFAAKKKFSSLDYGKLLQLLNGKIN
jgi:hypothetical protein